MSATIAMLAGLGKGYLDGAKERRSEERQAALDAQSKEEHDARMAEYKVKVDDRNELRSVTSAVPEAVYTPDQTAELRSIESAQDGNGQPYYSVGKNQDGTSYVRPNFSNGDGNEYRPIDISKKGSSFMGKVSDKPMAQSDIAEMRHAKTLELVDKGNSSAIDAVKARQSIAADQGTIKLSGIKITQAEAAQANDIFNANLLEATKGDFWAGISKVLTDTRAGGIGGVNVKHVISDDGKTVEVMAANAGGKYVPIRKFSNDEDGRIEALQHFSKSDIKTKLEWNKEVLDRKAAEEKLKNDRELLKIKQQQADANDRKTDAMAIRLAGGGSSAKTDSRLPEHVKLQYGELSKQINDIDGDLRKAKLSPDFNPDSPAVKAYQAQVHALKMQQSDLMHSYGNQSDPGDEFGFRNGKFTNPPSTEQLQAALSRQAANEAGSPGGGVVPATKPSVPTVQEQAAIDAKRVAEARSKASAPTPAAIAAGKGAYNEAGYSTVQGTIDGAKRGDKVALQLLQKMIDRGDTNPRQRQEIAEIQKAK